MTTPSTTEEQERWENDGRLKVGPEVVHDVGHESRVCLFVFKVTFCLGICPDVCLPL